VNSSPKFAEHQCRPINASIGTSDNAVVIVGIALRLQSERDGHLASTRKNMKSWAPVDKGLNDRLAGGSVARAGRYRS
jgi:hypothetical protein